MLTPGGDLCHRRYAGDKACGCERWVVLGFVPGQAGGNGHRLALRAHRTSSVVAVKAAWLSRALLAAASIGLVVLSAALAIRLAVFRSSVAVDIQAPERVLGFFTIVAGIDVLGVRLGAAGHPLATAILAGLAAVVWLVLTYGVPASLLLTRERDSVLGGVNGTWLLWVVGTQSLSVTASALVPVWPSQAGLLAPAAVGLRRTGAARPVPA